MRNAFLSTHNGHLHCHAGRGPAWRPMLVTNDWGSIAPGDPQVLIWDSGSFWDVLLNSGVHTQADLAGVIARKPAITTFASKF
jgi:hypothetical protein